MFASSRKLTKNADPDKYYFYRQSIGFDSRSRLSYLGFDLGENVFCFGVGNSSSSHIDKRSSTKIRWYQNDGRS